MSGDSEDTFREDSRSHEEQVRRARSVVSIPATLLIVDGVLGLRTRAGIRSYQKAENLPVTGQLDTRTAGKLGVTPEVRGEMGEESASQDKPSAGIKWTKGSRRTGKTVRSAPEKIVAPAAK